MNESRKQTGRQTDVVRPRSSSHMEMQYGSYTLTKHTHTNTYTHTQNKITDLVVELKKLLMVKLDKDIFLNLQREIRVMGISNSINKECMKTPVDEKMQR